jgi:hypothetical protein
MFHRSSGRNQEKARFLILIEIIEFSIQKIQTIMMFWNWHYSCSHLMDNSIRTFNLKLKRIKMDDSSNTTEQDEKLVPTMIYTPQRLIWGQLITKPVIRVSTWLQTEMAPKYINLSEAQVLFLNGSSETKPIRYPDVYVETQQIIAYHILQPADESPYFDPNAPNRKMEPVTALVGVFRFDCAIRLAEQSDLKNFLSVQKGNFLPVFDPIMSCPLLPSIKGVRSPFALLRQEATLFSLSKQSSN